MQLLSHSLKIPLVTPTCQLRQQDDQLKLRRCEIRGYVNSQVARAPHGVPGFSGLVQAEVLVVQLDGKRAGRGRSVRQLDSLQSLANEGLNLCCRSHLDELRRSEEHTSELQSRRDLVCR